MVQSRHRQEMKEGGGANANRGVGSGFKTRERVSSKAPNTNCEGGRCCGLWKNSQRGENTESSFSFTFPREEKGPGAETCTGTEEWGLQLLLRFNWVMAEGGGCCCVAPGLLGALQPRGFGWFCGSTVLSTLICACGCGGWLAMVCSGF